MLSLDLLMSIQCRAAYQFESRRLGRISRLCSWMWYASTYFVKWSMRVRRYLFCRGVNAYGPVISIDVISNGGGFYVSKRDYRISGGLAPLAGVAVFT
jgi:hypothetical protein